MHNSHRCQTEYLATMRQTGSESFREYLRKVWRDTNPRGVTGLEPGDKLKRQMVGKFNSSSERVEKYVGTALDIRMS